MSGTDIRERTHLGDALAVRCGCGCRLALFGLAADGIGFELIPLVGRYSRGEPVVADTWLRIDCPRCKMAWEGSRDRVESLWRNAIARGALFFSLPS